MTETAPGIDTAPVRLVPGDPAPEFTLPDADGTPVSLSSYRGRRVIVYCYPAALTPGCTVQAVDFTAAAGDLAEAGLDIIGVSPDAPEKLSRFREQEELSITLVSDPEKQVLTAYGAYGPKKLYGKEVVGVIRSTFVVGADGRIEKASYNVKATGHVAKLMRDLGID
ncbi:thioredoxin-dependent thiol peroxidase [Modestobacter marinus]|uniref:thioredoxin-dependent peroxiredoxin n=1 Tax=Modestobacter marinus TaxID=477641 RepID=A0A846LVP8_9ACTN|nr:thioredoxin-dependent thiol peroxidase [Modestobacter marinus]NIH69785.1 peroxiredoxin Q/BCP [Modestobacter marinus]GGL81623.1 putative peroxiredoxin [Modestobacter marinus]